MHVTAAAADLEPFCLLPMVSSTAWSFEPRRLRISRVSVEAFMGAKIGVKRVAIPRGEKEEGSSSRGSRREIGRSKSAAKSSFLVIHTLTVFVCEFLAPGLLLVATPWAAGTCYHSITFGLAGAVAPLSPQPCT